MDNWLYLPRVDGKGGQPRLLGMQFAGQVMLGCLRDAVRCVGDGGSLGVLYGVKQFS